MCRTTRQGRLIELLRDTPPPSAPWASLLYPRTRQGSRRRGSGCSTGPRTSPLRGRPAIIEASCRVCRDAGPTLHHRYLAPWTHSADVQQHRRCANPLRVQQDDGQIAALDVEPGAHIHRHSPASLMNPVLGHLDISVSIAHQRIGIAGRCAWPALPMSDVVVRCRWVACGWISGRCRSGMPRSRRTRSTRRGNVFTRSRPVGLRTEVRVHHAQVAGGNWSSWRSTQKADMPPGMSSVPAHARRAGFRGHQRHCSMSRRGDHEREPISRRDAAWRSKVDNHRRPLRASIHFVHGAGCVI